MWTHNKFRDVQYNLYNINSPSSVARHCGKRTAAGTKIPCDKYDHFKNQDTSWYSRAKKRTFVFFSSRAKKCAQARNLGRMPYHQSDAFQCPLRQTSCGGKVHWDMYGKYVREVVFHRAETLQLQPTCVVSLMGLYRAQILDGPTEHWSAQTI